MLDDAIEQLAAACAVDVKYQLSREELLAAIPEYQGIVVRSETLIDKDFLDAAVNLRIVGRAGSGLDNVDVPYATQRGVIVCNTPESNVISAAEHTLGLLLASSRNIPWADRFIKSGAWGRKQFEGSELYGKTLGIIGLGRIGGLVSQRARGFAMRVISYDPYIPDSRFTNLNVEKKRTLEELLHESDFITIHTPRTKETMNMVSDEQIAMMKPGVRLVNCARGGLFNEEALWRGLNDGHIASVGIDTWMDEPQKSHPLYEFETVVGTPHLGASTFEASKRVGEEVVAEVIAGLRGRIVKNAVNIPALSDESYAKLQAFIRLSEQMGILYRQIRRESVKRIEIVFAGQEIDVPADAKILSLVALKGVLEGSMSRGTVNFVNAGLLAEQIGIEVKETISPESGDYRNLIRMIVTEGDGTEFLVAGTVLEHKHPRIVQIGEFPITFVPEGKLAYVPHKNVPGVIGRVGSIIGEYGVNISRMVTSSGVNNEARDSIMILGVDNDLPQAAIDRCLQMDEIYEIKLIDL
ncbi:MAG: phosphoglycerate dehydrogenase [Actinobacteria bacterium RBG_16_64_13]|nr:MAG: phosphoglycerate dehydrogenase [Actinobacteria bacterium RBG_16_64_13]